MKSVILFRDSSGADLPALVELHRTAVTAYLPIYQLRCQESWAQRFLISFPFGQMSWYMCYNKEKKIKNFQMKQNHISHYHRHGSISYPVSIHQRLYSLIVIPILVLVMVFAVVRWLAPSLVHSNSQISVGYISIALLATFARLFVSYILALVISIPLAVLINKSAKAERVLLPLFDVMQSVPVLAFFPVVILFFVHYHFYNGAAVFILLLTMMWSIVFSVVGGLRVIPQDIKEAAKIFHVTGLSYVRQVLLPAVFPYIVTGSLLAWAGGWNIVIVAEVLHTYIPAGSQAQDLFGIGSLLVSSSAGGDQHSFFLSIVVMVIFVALLNFFVWQKLLRFAERFKFE
jgi:ABC-type anion transport system duplicated permease subunit